MSTQITKEDVLRELYKTRTATAKEIADILQCTSKEVIKHLRELRKSGAAEMTKGVYRCSDEAEKNIKKFIVVAKETGQKLAKALEGGQAPEVKPAAKTIKKTASNEVKKTEKAEMPSKKEPVKLTLADDEAKPANREELLNLSLSELEAKINAKVVQVSDKSLKLAVLERLAEILSDDIAEVLSGIFVDISSLDGAA